MTENCMFLVLFFMNAILRRNLDWNYTHTNGISTCVRESGLPSNNVHPSPVMNLYLQHRLAEGNSVAPISVPIMWISAGADVVILREIVQKAETKEISLATEPQP
jgi:hypothetical protein